jgi:hypothetical protein
MAQFIRRWLVVLAYFSAGVSTACGSADDSTGITEKCSSGTERCACYGNGTCNPGLTCGPMGACVGSPAVNDSGSSPDTEGTGGTSGTGTTDGRAQPGADAAASDAPGNTAGNYMDNCHADLTCWGAGGSGAFEMGPKQLRKVGSSCLLAVTSPSVVLNPDGTATPGASAIGQAHWRVDENGTLLVCDKSDFCWYMCRTDTAIRFPCEGRAVTCPDLPEAVCGQVSTCRMENGRCTGYIYQCDGWWNQSICEKIGCVWAPTP